VRVWLGRGEEWCRLRWDVILKLCRRGLIEGTMGFRPAAEGGGRALAQ
jgi:hypothetical protein